MILETADLGVPFGYVEIEAPAGISNFDRAIEDGLEERLRSERVWTGYAGYDFFGRVWFDAKGAFSCQVRIYGVAVATVRANSIKELMEEVSNEWGWW